VYLRRMNDSAAGYRSDQPAAEVSELAVKAWSMGFCWPSVWFSLKLLTLPSAFISPG